MNPALFDQLDATLRSEGPAAAIDRLCQDLRGRRDYHALFYALLMKKRHELGISPIPTGPSTEIPAALHPPYEEGIRQVAREVGRLFLDQGAVPQAYSLFRMIEELEPIRAALEAHRPGEDEDLQPLMQIAFYEGVHPRKGFDWILERYGICNAITTMSGAEHSQPEDVKQYCIGRLIRALYEELRGRLAAEVEAKVGVAPDAPADTPGVLAKLIDGRDFLFGEEAYHIDTSHLNSVVHFAMNLQPCEELGMARELCAYGARLTGRFMSYEDPPFEAGYPEYDAYLAILAGDDVEKNLDLFRQKAEQADPETVGTYPAEVLVNLLLRLGRDGEALAAARKYLSQTGGRPISCPTPQELCQRFGEYDTFAEVARAQNDPVHFLAGRLAARK